DSKSTSSRPWASPTVRTSSPIFPTSSPPAIHGAEAAGEAADRERGAEDDDTTPFGWTGGAPTRPGRRIRRIEAVPHQAARPLRGARRGGAGDDRSPRRPVAGRGWNGDRRLPRGAGDIRRSRRRRGRHE